MNRNWNSIWLTTLLVTLSLGAGCSGVRASRTVSPLDFLLPGLTQNGVPPQPIPDGEASPLLVAAN